MTLSDLLDQLNIDQDALLKRFSGNDKLIEHFLHKFPQDATFIQLENAIAQCDWDASLVAVHTLKGIAGNFGMERLYSACSNMLILLRSGDSVQDQAAREFTAVRQEYMHILECIEQWGKIEIG